MAIQVSVIKQGVPFTQDCERCEPGQGRAYRGTNLHVLLFFRQILIEMAAFLDEEEVKLQERRLKERITIQGLEVHGKSEERKGLTEGR